MFWGLLSFTQSTTSIYVISGVKLDRWYQAVMRGEGEWVKVITIIDIMTDMLYNIIIPYYNSWGSNQIILKFAKIKVLRGVSRVKRANCFEVRKGRTDI